MKDQDAIDLIWMLPYLGDEWKTLHMGYFAHLIGHEGENSLLSYLKQEGYVMELCAGGYDELDCMSNFYVNITLTKKGLAHTDKVVNSVFKYI